MISDILCDAREAIMDYLVNEPEAYGSMEADILALCAHMTTILVRLNTPPTPEELAEFHTLQGLREAARKRIGLPNA